MDRRIKQHIGMESILEHYKIPLVKGKVGFVKCPFHSTEDGEESNSPYARLTDYMYIKGDRFVATGLRCPVCKETWDIIEFVSKNENCNQEDAIAKISDWYLLEKGTKKLRNISVHELLDQMACFPGVRREIHPDYAHYNWGEWELDKPIPKVLYSTPREPEWLQAEVDEAGTFEREVFINCWEEIKRQTPAYRIAKAARDDLGIAVDING